MLTFVLITSAALCANLGVVLTALEARRQPAGQSLRIGLLVSLVKRPLWRLAALLDLSGWALKTAALLVAPVTIVAPAMALGLFVLVVFSALVLKEKPRVPALIGIALLAGGVALVALHSPPREVSIAGPVPWVICGGLLLTGALWVFAARARGVQVDVRLMALSCGFAWALNGILSKLMADAIDTSRWALLTIALTSAFAVGGLGYLSKTSALQAGEATTVESIVGVVNTLVPVALAPVLFGEDWPTEPGRAAQLTVGLILVGIGVYLLTHTTARSLARPRPATG
ncbi:MAG TPA: DMT family transporter [Miltoncostaeaceae bacterium]|nr:DMT family transporter [Miltoncostaeaceae bacterium]